MFLCCMASQMLYISGTMPMLFKTSLGRVYMNQQQARIQMVQTQLQTWGVFEHSILQAFMQLPRENFVPAEYQELAYSDLAIPLGHGQQMLTPKEQGRILQELKIKPSDKVLEIGTGSGCFTALLAQFAQHVFSIDIIPEFIQQAKITLHDLHINNVTLLHADGNHGFHEQAPYQVIVINASLPILVKQIIQDLDIGGRAFAIIGAGPAMQATLITRIEHDKWHKHILFETETPALINAPQQEQFQF